MKLGRISTCIIAATVAVSSISAPVANSAEVYQTNDVIASSWDTGIGAVIKNVVFMGLMLSSISSPGCHMMNTPACHPPA